jgi:hypothetical protein
VDILAALVGIIALLALGVASMAVTTARMPLPWLAGQTPRPRLWGIGVLPFGLMTLLQAVTRFVQVSPGTRLTLSAVGLVLVLIGAGFMWAGQRPARTRP